MSFSDNSKIYIAYGSIFIDWFFFLIMDHTFLFTNLVVSDGVLDILDYVIESLDFAILTRIALLQ